MINKRLLNLVPESRKNIIEIVLFDWISLLSNIVIMFSIAIFIDKLIFNKEIIDYFSLVKFTFTIIFFILIRFISIFLARRKSYKSSIIVKKRIRNIIYNKVSKLGSLYNKRIKTAELLQISVEGVEQLESYFALYLPQFFYSLIAPITLFFIVATISFKIATVLIICVPLIPISIILIQKFAKKILSKYWDRYSSLGDSFLENLKGLTSLKIYQSDKYKHQKMNKEAEEFRKVTMKVLTMQLNSITIMDLISYGGAAIGIYLAYNEYMLGKINFVGAFAIIMLSADFFLPLRLLGSFFHIAMNGIAASENIFKILDIDEREEKKEIVNSSNIIIKNLSFSYDGKDNVLKDINMNFKKGELVSIAGVSGSGKSTISVLLMNIYSSFKGNISIGNKDIRDLNKESLMNNISLISSNSYIFKGSFRDNLIMANKNADDSDMENALKKVNLIGFIREKDGLNTKITEGGNNLSGGQRQRLSLARAILKDSNIMIFDEATSSIDIESEKIILDYIYESSKTKTVILISHRLENLRKSNNIYLLENGRVVEEGNFDKLIKNKLLFYRMYEKQKRLEEYEK